MKAKFKLGDIVEISENSIATVILSFGQKVDVKFIYDKVYGEAIREYAKKDVKHYKFQIGDTVIYDGLLANVDRISKTVYHDITLDLTALENEDLTCTAMADKCEQYTEGEEIDQSEALFEAEMASKRIQNIAGGLTDKYFRDGNH